MAFHSSAVATGVIVSAKVNLRAWGDAALRRRPQSGAAFAQRGNSGHRMLTVHEFDRDRGSCTASSCESFHTKPEREGENKQ